MIISLRSRKTEEQYKKAIENGELNICPLCTAEPLQTFTHWKIIKNKFPYDTIAEEHHMIVPHRHCTYDSLTTGEIKELTSIKKEVYNSYHYLLEGLGNNVSIPDHSHLHLLKLKSF